MAHSPKFWDKIAEKYARQPIANEAAYQHKLEITRRYFRPDMEVLELGCGTGSTALVHAPYVRHIRATDIAPKMIEIARGKAAADGVTNVTFEVADIDTIDVPDGSVDAVLALNLLHLVEDKEAAMARIRRMLKPGGVFVASTVCLGDRMWWFKLIAPIGRLFGAIPLVKVFTERHFLKSLSDAGFRLDYDWRAEKGIGVFTVALKGR